MTLRANARLAGIAFLLYIATGISSLVLANRTTAGAVGAAAKLASIAQHEPLMRVTVLLTLLQFFYAVILGVTLYALTRAQDRDLALLALFCRATEGVMGALAADSRLDLLSVAIASTTPGPGQAATQALGAMLLKSGGPIGATCFAVGSTIFAYLFLRARSIPVPLAWLGLLSSALLVVTLPLQMGGILHSAGWAALVTWLTWMPLAIFEVTLAFWLIFKGVAPSASSPP